MIRRSFSGVAVAAALLLVSPLSAQQPLWTYQSPKDIEFRQLTPLGSLLLSTDGGLTALDPTSGRVLWQREDLGKVKEANFDVVPGSPFAVVSQGGVKGRFEVISLETGAKLWDSKALPIVFSQGMLAFPRDEMFFSVGNGGKTDYLGLDMKSGDVRWAQDKFFAKTPTVWPVKGSGGMVKRMSVEGHQGPLFDSDETAILWISEEGPARLNVKTGQKLWVATALKGFDAPATKTGFAEMQLENGVVYAPFEQKLAAFRAADGSMVWSKPAEFKSGIGQMDVTPQGIVVRGLTVEDIMDHYELREAIESYAAGRLAGRLNDAQRRELDKSLTQQQKALKSGDVAQMIDLDARFHLLLSAFLGNRTILATMEQLRDKIHQVIVRVTSLNAHRLGESVEEHRGIASAILDGDGALAVQRVIAHLDAGKRNVLNPSRLPA